jgi:hypothetical protein
MSVGVTKLTRGLGGKDLRNNKSGFVSAQSSETFLDQVLSVSINRTRGFVEKHDLWFLQYGASNGNALLLASR